MTTGASSSTAAHLCFFLIAASLHSAATSGISSSRLPSEGITNSTTTGTSRSTSTVTTIASSLLTTAATTCEYSSEYSRDYSSISGYYSRMISHHRRMQPFSSTANNLLFPFRAITATAGEESIAVYPFTRGQFSDNVASTLIRHMANGIFNTVWTS